MGNSAKRSARAIARAERAKLVAELRVAGKTWRQIGDELGVAAATALKDVEDYTRDLPAETVETLRKTLLERAETNYAFAFEASRKLTTPMKKLAAAHKIAAIIERHARVGHVIQEAPPVVNVTQTNNTFDVSKLAPEEQRTMHALIAKLEGQPSPFAGPESKEPST